MTTILVYGDSNSHGTLPLEKMDSFDRLPRGQRWPDIMEAGLQAAIPDIEVINSSLPGRTTVHEDLIDGGARNGLAVMPAILHSHQPIDLMILMLGTNDLKARFSVAAYEIARSLRRIAIDAMASGTINDLVIVSPVSVREIGTLALTYAGSEARQMGLANHIAEVADALNAGFFDAAPHVTVSPVDGVHFDAQGHKALGEAITPTIRARLNKGQ